MKDNLFFNLLFSSSTKSGFGIFQVSDGDRYEGLWVSNKKEGKGRYIWNNNDLFEGEFNDDTISKGKFYKNDGTIFSF